jgi:hypothetical protein
VTFEILLHYRLRCRGQSINVIVLTGTDNLAKVYPEKASGAITAILDRNNLGGTSRLNGYSDSDIPRYVS